MKISDTLKGYFMYMKDSELKNLYMEVSKNRKKGERPESLVPLAEHVKKNIGGDYTLREALDELMDALMLVVSDRYFAMGETTGKISMVVSYDAISKELEINGNSKGIAANGKIASDYVKSEFEHDCKGYYISEAVTKALK